jgi:hypothetical protein
MLRHRFKFLLAITIVAVVGFTGILVVFAYPPDWRRDPRMTGRPFVEADVTGTWEYTSDFPAATLRITLAADGTFHQEVRPSGSQKPLTQDGHWEIERDRENRQYLYIDHALHSHDRGWSPQWTLWHVCDSSLRPGKLAISGGPDPDPDGYREMKRVRPFREK